MRRGTISCVAIAMIALFVFGRSLGADGEVRLSALAVGVVAGAAAFMLPWMVAHLPHQLAGGKRTTYSEDALLQRWPARAKPHGFDRSKAEQ